MPLIHLSNKAGLAALTIRQTNILWIAYVAFEALCVEMDPVKDRSGKSFRQQNDLQELSTSESANSLVLYLLGHTKRYRYDIRQHLSSVEKVGDCGCKETGSHFDNHSAVYPGRCGFSCFPRLERGNCAGRQINARSRPAYTSNVLFRRVFNYDAPAIHLHRSDFT